MFVCWDEYGGVAVWVRIGGPCPPVCNSIVTPRHLFQLLSLYELSAQTLVVIGSTLWTKLSV